MNEQNLPALDLEKSRTTTQEPKSLRNPKFAHLDDDELSSFAPSSVVEVGEWMKETDVRISERERREAENAEELQEIDAENEGLEG